ncbi:MAG: hypothetical protein K2X77_12170 [Candidatus Obscuribacterales bacterium]|nr:hypothetical protein [Candidatus Obscuribacterales bacterium]
MNLGKGLLALSLFALLSGSNVTIPAHAAAVSGVAPAKIGVQVIAAPKEISLETDLGYKVKSGEYSQYKDDFDGLGKALQKAIVVELKDRMGNQAVVALPAQTDGDNSNAANPNYVIDGRIDKIRFEGNTLIPNYYELTLTAKMVSTKTGEVVWRLHHKLFAHMYSTHSEGAAEVFNQRMAQHVASKVADSIAHSAE